jgi:hypothetical protein
VSVAATPAEVVLELLGVELVLEEELELGVVLATVED